jgi:hypothetical protein
MRIILIAVLSLIAGAASAQAAGTWEVRKNPAGQCQVMKSVQKPAAGTRVAGPFKTKKNAENELIRLRKTPKCKR